MQTIAIDFDGVIHKYSKGWQDGACYDDEVEGVFDAIRQLMNNYTVFVFSTRSSKEIKKWLDNRIMDQEVFDTSIGADHIDYPKYGFTCERIPFWTKFWNKKNVLGITRRKLPAMVYIDDRALKFDGNWDNTRQEVYKFKTYQGK